LKKGTTTMMPFRLIAVLATLTAIMIAPAAAETYPSKSIKLIVSTSAGGITDLAARVVGKHISEQTGQTVVVENRSGGGGNIAMEAVAKSLPDGYTLGVANTGNIVINPFLYKHMSYSPLTDLVPVGAVGRVPLFLVVNGGLPVHSVKEFIAWVKAHPDKATYSSAGAGTTPHLAADAFNRLAKLDMVHVPYRGSTPATMAVLKNDVPMTFVSIGQHKQLVAQGKLKVLAVASDKRVSYLPDVPTFEEQGFPGFEIGTWFAMFAPAGTPKEIVDRLNGYVRELATDPAAKKVIEATYLDHMVLTAPQFAALVKKDAARWKKIVHDSGVQQ
jgi:tripartite-type tricarboxylate transporter receptor subunit TctC